MTDQFYDDTEKDLAFLAVRDFERLRSLLCRVRAIADEKSQAHQGVHGDRAYAAFTSLVGGITDLLADAEHEIAKTKDALGCSSCGTLSVPTPITTKVRMPAVNDNRLSAAE